MRLLGIVLGVLGLLGVGAASVSADTLRIGTCGTGGYWYQSGTTLANMISEHVDGMDGRAVPTACTIFNINALARGEQDLGLSVPGRSLAAYKGEGQFADSNTAGRLKALTTWYRNFTHIFTLDPDIQSIADLEGKRVAVGVPGGGTHTQTMLLLEAAGLEPGEDVQLAEVNLETGVGQLEAGQIDAQFWLMPIHNPTISRLTSTRDVYLIPVSQELADRLPPELGVSLATIEEGTYRNQDTDVATLASAVNLMARADLDDRIVHDVLAALYDNLDQFHNSLPETAKEVSPDNALSGIAIPLHPAARAFYEERGFPGLAEYEARLEANGLNE